MGVPGDPQGARPRVGLRLSRLEGAAARLPTARAGIPLRSACCRALHRGRVRPRARARGPVRPRGGAARARRAPSTGGCATTRSSPRHRGQGRRHAGTPVELLGRLIATTSFPELWEVGTSSPRSRRRRARWRSPRGRSPARSHVAPAGAPAREHGEPAPGTRSGAQVLRDYLARATGSRSSNTPANRSPEHRRAAPWRRRPDPRLPLPHGHRPRRRSRVAARPVVGRSRGRRGSGDAARST